MVVAVLQVVTELKGSIMSSRFAGSVDMTQLFHKVQPIPLKDWAVFALALCVSYVR